jgi:preprotein translocase subunit SecD
MPPDKEGADPMTQRASLTGIITALMLAVAALPASAATSAPSSDGALALDKMRAATAANAEKLLAQQGGSRILFRVDAEALQEAMLTDLRDEAFKILHDDRIPFTDLAVRNGTVEVRIADAKTRQRLTGKLMPPTEAAPSRAAAVGGDGLVRLVPTESGFAARLHGLVEQSIEMIEQRLRNDGIAQAGLQPDGSDRILVLLPGVTDPDRVAAMFSKRARVAFRLVDISMSAEDAVKGTPPSTSEVLFGFKTRNPYLVLKEVEIAGDDIADASPGFAPQSDQPIASFRFNAHGARRFAHLTGDNIGRPFAVVVDDRVIAAPVVREPILNGSGQISGNFTLEDANTIAMLLRSGTLPGRLSVVDAQVVQPASDTAKH